jgi:hypothetical protein
MKIVTEARKVIRPMLRARVFAGFARIPSAVDAYTAHRRTTDFFRRSGTAWTRSLN